MSSHQALCLRALLRALEPSEEPAELAAELQLSASQLKSMLDGVSDVPEKIFSRLVDLLNDRAVTERGKASPDSLLPGRRRQEPVEETRAFGMPAIDDPFY